METAHPFAPEPCRQGPSPVRFRPDKPGKRPGFTDSTGEYRDTRTGWLGREDSNLRMPDTPSGSGVVLLGSSGWLRKVLSEPVSTEFPVKQGKNREFCRIGGQSAARYLKSLFVLKSRCRRSSRRRAAARWWRCRRTAAAIAGTACPGESLNQPPCRDASLTDPNVLIGAGARAFSAP
jgi:hypothetical protein